MRLFALAVTIAGLLVSSALASGPAGFYPVSMVAIQPTPFHMDEPVMRVSFHATVPAPSGYRYFAFWQTQAPKSTLPEGCSPSSAMTVKGALGGTGSTVLTLKPEPVFGDAFCPGRSTLAIVLQRAKENGRVAGGADASTVRTVTTVSFRVLRP